MSSFSYTKTLIIIKSLHNFDTSLQKIEENIEKQNLEILAKIDHSKSASLNDLVLPPSTLILFGKPHLVNSIMLNNPVFTFFFPFRISLYQNNKDEVWISTVDLLKLEKEYGLNRAEKKVLKNLSLMLENIISIK